MPDFDFLGFFLEADCSVLAGQPYLLQETEPNNRKEDNKSSNNCLNMGAILCGLKSMAAKNANVYNKLHLGKFIVFAAYFLWL